MEVFDALRYAEATRKLEGLSSDALKANRLFVSGDHWQGGAGWPGVMNLATLVSSSEASQRAFAQNVSVLQKVFVSQNVIAEGIERHANGVIGRDPAFGVAPREEAQAERLAEVTQEAGTALRTWWERRSIQAALEEALTKLLYDAGTRAHVVLRVFIPPGLLIDGQVPRVKTLADALSFLWLDVVEPDAAAVVRDPATMQPLGVYQYVAEEGESKPHRVELTYREGLTTESRTVLRILEQGREEPVSDYRFTLGGHLFHYELRRPLFLTEQVRQLQRMHNKAFTSMNRNLDHAFPETYFLDAMPPGQWKWNDTGELEFVAGEMEVGPGVSNFLSPLLMVDGEGRITRTGSPSVVRFEAADPESYLKTLAATRHALMEEMDQLHTLMAGDATASGKSRQQALADYLLSLLATKSALDGAIRWLLEVALSLGAIFMGQPGRYQALRATADCRLDLGPVDPETMRVVMELVEKKLMMRKTGMGRIGIDDPVAELEGIKQEQEELRATAPPVNSNPDPNSSNDDGDDEEDENEE